MAMRRLTRLCFQAITQYVGFLDRWSINSQWSFSAFVGIAPPLLSAILQLVLPIIMRSLTSRQGLLTRNQVDRTVLARYWAFLIITQLFIFSLLGVVFNLITEVRQAAPADFGGTADFSSSTAC